MRPPHPRSPAPRPHAARAPALATLALAASLGACAEPTGLRDSEEAPIALASSARVEAAAAHRAMLALDDAAARVVPTLTDSPLRSQLAQALLDAGAALGHADGARATRELAAAQKLLGQYGAGDGAELDAIRLALNAARAAVTP